MNHLYRPHRLRDAAIIDRDLFISLALTLRWTLLSLLRRYLSTYYHLFELIIVCLLCLQVPVLMCSSDSIQKGDPFASWKSAFGRLINAVKKSERLNTVYGYLLRILPMFSLILCSHFSSQLL